MNHPWTTPFIMTSSGRASRLSSDCSVLEIIDSADYLHCLLTNGWTTNSAEGNKKIKTEVGADEKKAQQGRLRKHVSSSLQLKGSKSVPCAKLSFNEQVLLGHMDHKEFSSASGIVKFSHWSVVHLITCHPKNFPVQTRFFFCSKGKNKIIGHAWQLALSPPTPKL